MANNILLRDEISKRLRASQERLIELTSHLVRIDTQNPPGRTGTIVKTVAEILQSVDGIELESCISEEPIVNLVARIRGRSSGRRLIFNGHLDTYPIGDSSLWSVDPFDAELKGGKLYGRGTADMKGGISCSLVAFETLADFRDAWSGELVVTLAGDEETMGRLGTGYLLENVPHAKGEAMICGDVGSPKIIWFGEKGMIWLDVFAVGRAAHGAHVHKGRNAIECLFEALQRLIKLRKHPVRTPVEVANAIDNSKHVLEKISGEGEAVILKSVTVNIGQIDGGTSTNLVPDKARSSLDIRLPAGVTVQEIEARIEEELKPIEGISYRITRRYEPTWTDPDHELIRTALRNGQMVLGSKPLTNMRVGASDARLYRMLDIPSVVIGLTPYNLGGPDEHIMVDELVTVGLIHSLTAFDFLSADA